MQFKRDLSAESATERKEHVAMADPEPPREQTELLPCLVHVLPRRVQVEWFVAIYLLMLMAGECSAESSTHSGWTEIGSLGAGWSDASTGPLLLRIQGYYSISYTIVSLIFISNFVGFLTAALTNVWFSDHLGMGKTLFIGACVQVGTHDVAAQRLLMFTLSLSSTSSWLELRSWQEFLLFPSLLSRSASMGSVSAFKTLRSTASSRDFQTPHREWPSPTQCTDWVLWCRPWSLPNSRDPPSTIGTCTTSALSQS
jgi:hypothetical protein